MAIKIAGTEVINDNKELVLAKLTEINSSIADTAVDIFVYDTRKDSDGGAWRKRTQHTSWYNEGASATRGSRKEFPAVAVIVVDNDGLYIYDGDDPDLPMWMKANDVPLGMVLNSSNANAVAAKNGIIALAGTSALWVMHFVDDRGDVRNSSRRYDYNGNIEQRNDGLDYTNQETSGALASSAVNDVAMTVLPNAPIDAATGLPVPTIAVATAGGISVILDDGTVTDSNSTSNFTNLDFLEGAIVARNNNAGAIWRFASYATDAFQTEGQYTQTQAAPYIGKGTNYVVGTSNNTFVKGRNANDGVTTMVAIDDVKVNGMAHFLTSSYATGWMNGDIKLATLSDTDDTDVTGSELVTNGTFDTDTSGWTAAFSTISVTSGTLQVVGTSNFNYAKQIVTGLTVGKKYVFQADIVTGSGNTYIYVRRGDNGGGITNGSANGVGSYALTFEAPTTSVEIRLYQIYQTTSTFDNVSLRLAEEDRSVNGNGLQVFGTVPKTAVATGAELVAYGGFSNDNYLQQPYNSDLNFGTGDFCVMGWVNVGSNTSHQGLLNRDTLGATGAGLLIEYRFDAAAILFQPRDGSTVANSFTTTGSVGLNRWIFFVGVRDNSGTVQRLYLDGELNQTVSVSALNVDSTTAITRLGREVNQGRNFSGKMALWRISETVPSPEQIKKIYEDEKVLFQENAQATLYGDSDAVTALAYDDSTELLHVGTSAGRSVFQGLRRVDNTTTAVGAAISASNGLVADE